jgi:hypothetical protein
LLDEIPAQVRLFLEERIHSVAQLELLLLLKNDPGKAWAAAEASRALAVPGEMAAAHLSELQGAGLLASSGGLEASFRYGPQSTELSQLVESLATIYQERRVSLITLIYSRPVDKVRTFADAFRFRKD